MRRISRLKIITFFCLLLFGACNDILFDKPQPGWIHENLKSFPGQLQGLYYNGHDTIEVKENRITQFNAEKKEDDLVLSDSLIFRMDGKNYFLNFREENTWTVFLLSDMGDSVVTFELKSNDEKVRSKLNSITEVHKIKGIDSEEPEYLIKPGDEEFRKILDANLFSTSETYHRLVVKKEK